MNHKRKSLPVCTIVIIAINILVFFALEAIGDTENSGFMVEYGAMFTPYLIEKGEIYRLFTCMFLHFGISHLINNMICLASFGYVIEKNLGKIRFLIIYVIAGLGGNILSMYMELVNREYSVSAGASGAIMGLSGALFFCVIINKGHFGDFSFRDMLIFIGLTIYSGYVNTDVDDMAHLGGLIIGFVLALLVYGTPKLLNRNKRIE